MKAYLINLVDSWDIVYPHWEWVDSYTGFKMVGADVLEEDNNHHIHNIEYHSGKAKVKYKLEFFISGEPDKISELNDKIRELLKEIEL